MGALFFITRNNIKKKKRETAVLFFLIVLAALLLYTSVSVFAGINGILDAAYERAHTADLLFVARQGADRIPGIFKRQEEVVEYEQSDCLYFMSVGYRSRKDEEKRDMQFLFGRIEEERTIGTLAGYEGTTVNEDDIVLPYYLKASEGFSVGDTCFFTFGEREYEFRVAGFVEDALFATPLNVSTYSGYISSARMEALGEENPEAQYIKYSARLRGGEDSYEFEKKISMLLTQEVPELEGSLNIGLNWKTMRGGVAMMSRISMGVILIFSLLLTAVVLIIIRFSIRNFMEMNRKNIGILQAAGYTTGQLVLAVMLEAGLITAAAAVLGILLGIAGSRVVGVFQGMMLGVSWNQTFHPGAALFTIMAMLFVVTGAAGICGSAYRKASVLDSLRGGIYTHNFKKNYLPLEKTGLPKEFALACKSLLNEKGRTLSVFFIVTLLSFASCVGFGLFENFGVRSDQLLKLVGAESGDMIVTGGGLDDAGRQIRLWDGVGNVLFYNSASIQIESGGEKTEMTCDVWRDTGAVQNEMIVEGRIPKYENEIVVTTSIAERLHVKTGDTVYVTGSGERLAYVISGIDQKINNMGLKAMLTEEGAARLNGASEPVVLYVYLAEGESFESMSARIGEHFPELTVSDSEKQVAGVMQGVTIAMKAICVLFVLITVFVVVMVEVLLIRSQIIRERRNFGVSKALGFTTGQLIAQTVLVNLPVIALGAMLGMGLTYLFMNPLTVLCLSFVGIRQCEMGVPFVWSVVTVIGIVAVALATSFLSSVRIRKIEPVRMLTE